MTEMHELADRLDRARQRLIDEYQEAMQRRDGDADASTDEPSQGDVGGSASQEASSRRAELRESILRIVRPESVTPPSEGHDPASHA